MIRISILSLTVLAAGMFGLSACSDDDPVVPQESMAINVTVLDAAGQPLADQAVHVLPQLPPEILQDGLKAEGSVPAAVSIGFDVPVPCLVDMEIRDVAGATIRTLISGYAAPAGQHVVIWNGLDDQGVHRYTAWYEVALACRDADTGTIEFEDTRGMMMVLLDNARTPYRTDAAGQVTITDPRLVPGFWDLPPMNFTDENGVPIGIYAPSREMQVRAAGVTVFFEATEGPQSVVVRQMASGAAAVRLEVVATTVGLVTAPPVEEEYRLRDPYPNPFN